LNGWARLGLDDNPAHFAIVRNYIEPAQKEHDIGPAAKCR
jgi:hypothetical protein